MDIDKAFEAAIRHYQTGKLEQAANICEEILEIYPNNFEVLHFLGIINYQLGNYDFAIQYIKKALQFNPKNADAYYNLGNVFVEKGHLDEAIDCYQKALQYNPNLAEAYNNLGNALQEKGQLDEAINCYQKALRVNPHLVDAYNNLGNVFREKGQLDTAITCYQKTLQLNPSLIEAYNKLGNAFKEQGQLDEAVECFQKLIELNPNLAEAYNNIGATLYEKKQIDEAVTYYQKALRLNPTLAVAYYNLGNALWEQGKMDEALVAYNRALDCRPNDFLTRWARCMSQLPIIYKNQTSIQASRKNYHEELIKLISTISLETPQDIEAAAIAVGRQTPFYLPCQGFNDRELQQHYGGLVCKIMALRCPEFSKQPPVPRLAYGEPLRIGFVSKFFYWHSVWKIPLSGWIQNLDKKKFSIYGYHTGRTNDHFTEIARLHCTRFIEDVYSFKTLCQIIRDDNLHVLIYPEIGMDPMTVRLAGLKLAHVQCTSLGHPDTSGFPTIDYYLSSELMEPLDGAEHYTEKLIRLPNLGFYYTPFDVPSIETSRETFGLRQTSILYLCSHALFTYLPQYDEVFPRIAEQIGDCQFLFISNRSKLITEQFCLRISRTFNRFNLNVNNFIVFLPRCDQMQYHALNCLSDIFLDSIGWSANNSTFEAIACNLPVVTFPGKLMWQRHCAGILTMMGMTETIASSLDEYVELAVRLGRDSEWRRYLSEKIAENKHHIYRDRTCINALEDFLEKAVEEKLNQS
jgi:predicted O-linked N-acetylglucosamine transferase (SPINDLY family)